MATPQPNRIATSKRPARPLPAPPSLAQFCKGSILVKTDIARYDAAVAEWFGRFQVAFAEQTKTP